MTPSAPTDTRAARSSSPPLIVRSLPSASTSSIASTWPEMIGWRVPVPCVPVEIAPASDWASMSPRFDIARPRACSSRESACSRIPRSTRTSPLAASASSTRASASSEMSVPSVTAPALNEWPAPTTRTGPGPSTMACASSARVRGIAKRAGRQRWEPDQLTHSIAPNGTVRAMDVEPERLAELQREGEVQVIDVREDYEWDAGRIPGGARHLELGLVAARAETIHREIPVVFDRPPRRRALGDGRQRVPARRVWRRLQHDGRESLEWEARGLPLEPDDGHVADH